MHTRGEVIQLAVLKGKAGKIEKKSPEVIVDYKHRAEKQEKVAKVLGSAERVDAAILPLGVLCFSPMTGGGWVSRAEHIDGYQSGALRTSVGKEV